MTRPRFGFRAAACLIGLLWLGGCATQDARRASRAATNVERERPRQLSPQQRQVEFQQTYEQGLALADQGEFGLALGAFQHCLELRPDSVEALLAVGACHESIGDAFEAIRHYRRALALNPAEPVAYTNLGTAYIKLYHRERNPTWRELAVDAWRRALALNPDQSDVQGFLRANAQP